MAPRLDLTGRGKINIKWYEVVTTLVPGGGLGTSVSGEPWRLGIFFIKMLSQLIGLDALPQWANTEIFPAFVRCLISRPNTQGSEAGGLSRVWDNLDCLEFEVSQGYIERPCIKKYFSKLVARKKRNFVVKGSFTVSASFVLEISQSCLPTGSSFHLCTAKEEKNCPYFFILLEENTVLQAVRF